jgi:2-polyprenyl-6-hydroxyphenyl methylase/3-demethylubiquinone-9 3-methyltransferase
MEADSTCINNAFYDDLGRGWLEAQAHPIALLRAENTLRNPWICQVVQEHFDRPVAALDVGCGAGFLTHALAGRGHRVTGLDLSASSLQIAQSSDPTGSAQYVVGSATALPFADQSFEVVCAMDLLEHVEDPQRVIAEASRVLKPGGLFFFHTFNRNPLSWLIILKGVDWFVPAAIPNMHVYRLFIKPGELTQWCTQSGLRAQVLKGVVPDFSRRSFWRLLVRRTIDPDFRFRFVKSLATGYSGFATKVTAG